LKGENKFAQHQQQQQNQRGKVSKNAFAEDGEGEVPDDIFDTSQGLTAVTNDWWSSMVTQDDIDSLFASHKMRLLFEILKMCEKQGEKILIFSTFVAVLDCIEQFMKAIQNQDNNPNAVRHGYSQYKTNWVLGRDYYRLDGSTPKATRQHMINEFNRPGSSPRCFLISAKAGGQGINLISANRCIIVDTSWNPANDVSRDDTE
jgi:transcriptional regulator ATRX